MTSLTTLASILKWRCELITASTNAVWKDNIGTRLKGGLLQIEPLTKGRNKFLAHSMGLM